MTPRRPATGRDKGIPGTSGEAQGFWSAASALAKSDTFARENGPYSKQDLGTELRSYLAVEDIQQAVKKAEEHGATVAYPPTRQGQRGTFAIVIQGDVQHGLWQR
jgi:predicted enzyme related to lactoylglutathione lyase